MGFTEAQQKEIDRLSPDRIGGENGLILEKLEKRTPEELRARVNILGQTGTEIIFSPDNNYGPAIKKRIVDSFKKDRNGSWLARVIQIVADGPTIEERLKKLETV